MEAWARTRQGSTRTQARPDPLGLKSLLPMEIRNGNVFGPEAKISRARVALGSVCTFYKMWPFGQWQSDMCPQPSVLRLHSFPRGLLIPPFWIWGAVLEPASTLISHLPKAR